MMMQTHIDPNAFGYVVADVARLFRAEIDRRIAEAGLGLTPGEGRALSHVARAGLARQTSIAERMGVEAMTMSGYLDRLEGAQLVERLPDPSDRRAKLVRVTANADAVLVAIHRISTALRAELARSVTQTEWEATNASLRRLRDGLSKMRETRESHAA